MKLDDFDIRFLNHDGVPQETLRELLGWIATKGGAKVTRVKIRKYLRHKQALTDETEPPSDNVSQSIELTESGEVSTRLLRLSAVDKKNRQKLLEHHGYDPAQWKLIRAKQTIWHSPQKDNDPRELYSSRIEVEPLGNPLTKDELQNIFNELQPPEIAPFKYEPNNHVLVEPSILDFHLGKDLSLQDEIDLFKSTVLAMLQKIDSYHVRPERCLWQIGQDILHIDNSNKTTTYGTQMDVTEKWSEIYKTALELLIWAIDQFRQLCPVDCFYVPGNHDKVLSYCLALTLNKYYEKCDDVAVDVIDYPRKYYQYGKNLIGMSHGREEGKRIQHNMQEEAPQLWANTIYREFHLGDLHHEKTDEIGGVIFRRTSAITDLDQWHIDKGYKAIRKAPMYVWHKDGGKDILDVLVKLE